MKALKLPDLGGRLDVVFETYKHSPGLLGAATAFDVPAPVVPRAPEQPYALEAEARVKLFSGSLALLFDGSVAAVALGTGGVALRELSARDGASQCVDCGAQVLSIVRAERAPGSRRTVSRVRGADGAEVDQEVFEELVVATTVGDGVVVIAASRTVVSGAMQMSARLVRAASLPPGRGCERPEAQRTWAVAAAYADSSIGLLVVAHRVAGRREVEVVALRLAEGEEMKQLATLRGARPPWAVCFARPWSVLLVADDDFAPPGAAPPAEKEDVAEKEKEDVDMQVDMQVDTHECPPPREGPREGSPVVTAWELTMEPPSAECFLLPRGDLLAAWPEAPEAPPAGVPYASGLAIALDDGCGGATVFRAVVPDDGAVALEGAERIPGLAACASARRDLRLILASPKRTFLGLIETRGQNAVSVFRNPGELERAPTVAIPIQGACVEEAEVLGAALGEDAIVVLLRGQLLRCTLDEAARVVEEVRKGPPPRASELPMGIDRAALLRMLDMQGED